jgi:hypothetical protein
MMGLQYVETSPQLIDSNKLIQYCKERGIHAERPFARMELQLS